MDRDSILVVDDDENLLYAYTRILESAGYRVIPAATGAAAFELADRERPPLILLDAVLPDASGLDVCQRIKSDPLLSGTLVIMVSGLKTTQNQLADGLEAGADGYLMKPVERRALLAYVRAMLRIRRGEVALRESEARHRELADSFRRQAEELRAANVRLEEYNRLKAEFVANMSHELRTPLNAIIGFAQLMQMGMGGQTLAGAHADAVERILRNSRHLLTLIDGVLDLSKIEAGRQLVHPEHIDLGETVQAAFGELQSLARQKKLDYRLAVEEDLRVAYTDPVRVRQVAINLISNAIKFTPKGSVEVELSRAGEDHWRLTVRDSGIGIRPDDVAMIFERFRQVDGSMTRNAGGTGLGLSIVQEIVKQLGGSVSVESELGQGSSFTAVMPFAVREAGEGAGADAAALESLAAEATAQSGEQSPLVLVVEDDPDAAVLMTETLTAAGYRVRVADDGAAGLRLAGELRPDAVTLDIMMPSLDGWRVLKALRADPATAEIPVIICSIVDNRALGYRLGAAEYLVKPVEPRRLLEALEGVGAAARATDGYVLVVDDERPVRELLLLALKQAGYVARAAASGEAALKIAAEGMPQAVLTDLIMPGGMSGFELIARLRASNATEQTPIIVITGKDVSPEDRRLMSGQIADIIRKGGLSLPGLARRVRDVLGDLGVRPHNG